jgi:nitrite reductase (NADH) small subunit
MLPSEPGTFVYGLQNRVIRCPWHNWEFDLVTGRSLFTNDRRRLSRVALTVANDWINVDGRHRRDRPGAAVIEERTR